MNRREFLATSSGLIVGMATPNILLAQASKTGQIIYSGWLPSLKETEQFKAEQKVAYFSQAAGHLADTGANKQAFLWKFFEKVTNGPLIPHDQSIGDCVAEAFGLGIDILDAIQIAHGRGIWKNKCATEIIYAGSRVEIGQGTLGRKDGSYGSWGARWCRDYGILLRQPYLDGKYDFTVYSGTKARKWGHVCRRCTPWGGGVPDELEPLTKEHPVKTVTLITSWEQARDSLYNGYPIAVGSDVGFTERRDKDGFVTRSGIWYHDILLAGMNDIGDRPGGLFINSWGTSWISGPTQFDQPVGSFWADADVIDKMLKQEDSFAMSNYIGYPAQNLDYKLY